MVAKSVFTKFACFDSAAVTKNYRKISAVMCKHAGRNCSSIGESIDWENIASLLLNRLRTSTAVSASLELVSKELALILERYLERDLEALVAQAIPILAIDQVIVDRVKSTSAEELELATQGIVKMNYKQLSI
jgi:uncharacterized membrane protein YheB (UPF0754 family)